MSKSICEDRPARARRILCLLVVLLIGSATATLADKRINPDRDCTDELRGPYPFNYRTLVLQDIAESFFDPESAQGLEIARPVPGWQTSASMKKTWFNTVCTWYISYSVNAKNRMGGYVGKQDRAIWIKNGRPSMPPGMDLFHTVVKTNKTLPPSLVARQGELAFSAALEKLPLAEQARVAAEQEAAGAPTTSGEADYIAEIRALGQLRDEGLITEEEFKARKGKILDAHQ